MEAYTIGCSKCDRYFMSTGKEDIFPGWREVFVTKGEAIETYYLCSDHAN